MGPLPACSPKKDLFCPSTTTVLWTSDWSTAPPTRALKHISGMANSASQPFLKLQPLSLPGSRISSHYTTALIATKIAISIVEFFRSNTVFLRGNPILLDLKAVQGFSSRSLEDQQIYLERSPTHMENYVELSILTSSSCWLFLPSDLL